MSLRGSQIKVTFLKNSGGVIFLFNAYIKYIQHRQGLFNMLIFSWLANQPFDGGLGIGLGR